MEPNAIIALWGALGGAIGGSLLSGLLLLLSNHLQAQREDRRLKLERVRIVRGEAINRLSQTVESASALVSYLSMIGDAPEYGTVEAKTTADNVSQFFSLLNWTLISMTAIEQNQIVGSIAELNESMLRLVGEFRNPDRDPSTSSSVIVAATRLQIHYQALKEAL